MEEIQQGFLSLDRDRVVRVRLKGDQGYLTIKGRAQGLRRAEYEYAIPADEAREMLEHLVTGSVIHKRRHRIAAGDLVWEVDEFLGDNAGLIVAEIEVDRDDREFARPDWIAENVSDDPRYFNSNLATRPYKDW